MELAEYDRRRRLLRDAQVWLHSDLRVNVPMPELRPEPTTATPQSVVTLTPTAEGAWAVEQWYSEIAGQTASSRLVRPTQSAALDWLWFSRTRDYFKKHVVPSAEQPDRNRHSIRVSLSRISSKPQPVPDEPWEDTSTDTERLGTAGLALLDSWTSSAIRIARNPHTPANVLDMLADSPCDSVRWQVAGNPATSATAISKLRQTDDPIVRWYLAARAETPTSDVVEWSAADSALWGAVLDRPDAPADALARILESSGGALRISIAAHPSAPADLISALARSADRSLGMNLLRGGRSSEADIADIMSAAVSWDVYQLTRELSTKPLPLGALVAHRLAQSEVLQHRILAASSAATLDDTDLDALSGDPSYWVRTALAAAAGHVERVMRLLAEDPQFSVRQNVASNRNAPADLIADMAITGDFVIRRISVNNPALPMDVLRRLTGDFVGEVANTARKALARRERAEAREAQP